MNASRPYLETVDPGVIGIDSARWERVLSHAAKLIESNSVPALSFQVQRRGLTTGVHTFGHRDLAQTQPVNCETRYLIASLTKPMVAMATLLLVERGLLTLNQRVSDILPELRGPGKKTITIKHLLTHTSGLPDMLPNNRDLRARNATLAEFVAEIAKTELVFPTGQSSQYQSMGFALLGPIMEAVTGQNYQQFIREELFEPLGMSKTWLGLPEEELRESNIAEVRVPEDQVGEDTWNWNSVYWKTFGAPWGGAIAPVEDVSRFCRCMLTNGITPAGKELFHPATILMATQNRLEDFPDLPESFRRGRGWGYGWRMDWPDHRGSFGDLFVVETVGHWGATGCLFWMDLWTETAVVLLSTKPIDRTVSPLVNLSNLICAALPAEYE